MSADNKSLGKFMLDGIPPAPRGVPQVEVTFDVDSNGILTVKAKEKTTGKEQSIRIEGSTGLSKEDIEKMQKDAEAHASDDAKRKELVEARNIAEQMTYTAEKAIKDNGEKVGPEIVKEVSDAVEAVKTAAKGEDPTTIKTSTETLSQAMMKIGEAMAKSAEAENKTAEGEQKPPAEGPEQGGREEGAGPADAQFKEKE
jgi:molecular chaperone DnaK